ncbi:MULTISPECIES: GNAT family N-acetyltransferase [Actinoalloteichus]|uniref:Acetyltransferase, ribosomal protein N-acetylase n=1 Tax=Actinoalloteichus fjordicus TaxID=1612552 RepID=A0AAC9LCU0_9PSEU|nr:MULTISPECIES: GNAT family N-acetyltransferase [Actinoalloteichus]APU14490.1 acetyltransferase, ribosomal protein N-acetylase [Actinoalloteichus fjordicus]APU20458.1 acetyltransferase, ribosomal protein N-acetylase [Actinoalloteichus sp. GBA129-24]
MVELRTERLTLLPLSEWGVDLLAPLFTATEVRRALPPGPVDEGAVRRLLSDRIERAMPSGMGDWVVCVSGRPVGLTSLCPSVALPGGLPEVGWLLGREHRGRGIAAEAGSAVLRHAFHRLELPSVWSLTHPDDLAGASLARRLGFVEVGQRLVGKVDHAVAVCQAPPAGLHHLEVWVEDLDRARYSLGWLLAELGWVEYQRWSRGISWRHGGTYLVVERSPAVRPGGHDRLRAGMNHLALRVRGAEEMHRITEQATGRGWRLLFPEVHPYAGGPMHLAAYLEDPDGFEVELVADPAGPLR